MIQEGDLVRIKTMEELSATEDVWSDSPGFNDHMKGMCGGIYRVDEVLTNTRIFIRPWIFKPEWVDVLNDPLSILLQEIKK